MKKLLTLALVGAMLTATGITAFAEETTVSYEVQPTYTVTIPATVDLGDNDVTANIDASDVLLETGKQIKVELTSASNTASGSTFNAKNGDSAVTYTITGDKAIAVGDTVATFTADGSKNLTFSAADKSAATVAGTHTETLTFTISVEETKDPSLTITNAPTEALLYNTEGTLTAQLKNSEDTVTWSCDNSDIIELNADTGEYRVKGYGEATITATAGELTDTCTITGTTTFTPETLVEGTVIRPGDSFYTVTSGDGVAIKSNSKTTYFGATNTAVTLFNVQNARFGNTRESSHFTDLTYEWNDDLDGYRLVYTGMTANNYKIYKLEPVYKTDSGN